MVLNLKGEMWKDIKGFEGIYQISNYGRVKSFMKTKKIGRWKEKSTFNIPERLMKEHRYNDGYMYYSLYKNGITKKIKTHRLVAIHFIENPNDFKYINHINAIRDDNRIENLEWCTHSHNMKHKFILGNQSNKGKNNPQSKSVINLKTGDIFDTVKSASLFYRKNYSHLCQCLNGSVKNNTDLRYLQPYLVRKTKR